jgi:hypothetical protein
MSSAAPAAGKAGRGVLEATVDVKGRQTGSRRRPLHAIAAPTRSKLRWPAAAGLMVAGAVHVPPVPQHLREAPYVGVLFIGLAVTCPALGALLAWRDTRAVWRLAAAITAATALGYVASRLVGLPEIGDDVGNWSDRLGTIAVAAELETAALGCVALRRDRPGAQRHARFRAPDTVRESTPTRGKDDNT